MKNMRQLMNLMESVVSVPCIGTTNEDTESDMQTAATAASDDAYAAFDQAQGQATEESKDYSTWRNYLVTTSTGKWQVYGPLDKAEMQAHLASQYGGSGARIYGEVIDVVPDDSPVAPSRDEKSGRSYWDESVNEESHLVREEAPPGMEDVVMKLKKEYPNDHSKAFATAWSIYNKKHGKANESVPAVDYCKQSNPASADVACAMEENMSEYDNNFIGSAIKGLYQFATSEDELKNMVAGETGYGSNPEFDAVFGSELAKFLNTASDSEFGPEYGGEEFNENKVESIPMTSEIASYVLNALQAGGGNVTMTDLWDRKVPYLRDFFLSVANELGLDPEEEFIDVESEVIERLEAIAHSTIHEAYDIQNGYNDVEHAEGIDFFPDGADSPVVDNVGPSGARQGDNPEQKKMQVAETHKELVYNYRKFLKEST